MATESTEEYGKVKTWNEIQEGLIDSPFVIPAQAGIQGNNRCIPGLRNAPPGMTAVIRELCNLIMQGSIIGHCEERSDEAVSNRLIMNSKDCFAPLAPCRMAQPS